MKLDEYKVSPEGLLEDGEEERKRKMIEETKRFLVEQDQEMGLEPNKGIKRKNESEEESSRIKGSSHVGGSLGSRDVSRQRRFEEIQEEDIEIEHLQLVSEKELEARA